MDSLQTEFFIIGNDLDCQVEFFYRGGFISIVEFSSGSCYMSNSLLAGFPETLDNGAGLHYRGDARQSGLFITIFGHKPYHISKQRSEFSLLLEEFRLAQEEVADNRKNNIDKNSHAESTDPKIITRFKDNLEWKRHIAPFISKFRLWLILAVIVAVILLLTSKW